MNRFTPLLAFALAACLPVQFSNANGGMSSASSPGLADIQVIDRANGQALPIYRHNGELWVAGIPGHSYAVRLHNDAPGRILTVVSVDGVNAVTGESAAWNQRGYVLSYSGSYDVSGWRKTQEKVADFVFTSLEDSYAATTGRPHDVGVIGVAVFREKIPEPPVALTLSTPPARDESAGAAPAASAPASPVPAPSSEIQRSLKQQTPLAQALSSANQSLSRLGTGHGPSEYSYVGTTSFERAHAEPDFLVSIRYDRPETLVAMGVIPGTAHPRAFPDSAALGFVPDPPTRR